jgi:arylsulfatase A-like enzyme
MLDWFPTFARLASAALPDTLKLDGQDLTPLLLEGRAPSTPRTLFHYFGGQLQAVRQGDWKLIVPVAARPQPVPPSLWFEHQPQVFERQHRPWPKATLYNLAGDASEATDVAAAQPEIVERLLKAAKEFDASFQREQRPMQFVDGPKPPKPQQVRGATEDLSGWRTERR